MGAQVRQATQNRRSEEVSRVCTVLCACLIWNKGLPPPFSLSLTMSAALLTRAKARGEEVRRRTGRTGLCWKRCQNYSLQGESDPAALCPRHLAVLFRLGVQPHPLPVILPCCSYDDGAVFPPGCPSALLTLACCQMLPVGGWLTSQTAAICGWE